MSRRSLPQSRIYEVAALSRVPPQVPEHVAHVLDQLAPLVIVEALRLFNARGLY
jgi:hypothetical protein